ncbi:SH3 domain-containing protein [Streptomyces yaizuensis]|uniref:SH3 domain-containing protein n=1 Tax=Streptomyces yaizuensis TaxID=2989713 RepID=A0ABQ5P3V5_9ACTN|nr:hypothetical protein [Streptomyces sp. YSPA8]GLF97240.1 SH3 domain-containing protein [Streptomyces sp. YSPA8]
MKRQLTALLPAVAAVALTVPIGLATATPAAAAAPCGTVVSDRDGSSWVSGVDGVNMRSGSSTSCAIPGVIYAHHSLDYHCYTAQSGATWTFIRNDTTDRQGWVRDDLLPVRDGVRGSRVSCNI